MLLRARKTIGGVALAAAALALGACGGDERQDADEPEGTFAVRVVEAEFPSRQALAQQTKMRIRVRNVDRRPIPNIAVTVNSFQQRTEQPDVADPVRPIWIIDDVPKNGTTAYTNTWAGGTLAPGEERTFEWLVTPVDPGRYDVKWQVAAGLDGKANARLPGGGIPQGVFDVVIPRDAPEARVDPETGDVVRIDPETGRQKRVKPEGEDEVVPVEPFSSQFGG